MKKNLTEDIRITDIAEQAGYSGYYISKCFKNEIGISLGDYIKQRKIEYAKLLLRTSEIPVSEIAERVCFSSPSHFAAVFRKLTGVTPSEYRSEHQ